MAQDFSSLEGAPEAGAVTEAAAKSRNKAEVKAIINNFAEKVEATPGLKEALYSKKDSIEVINSCGYGDKGGIVNSNKGASDGKRVISQTSDIVGYIIKNVGTDTIGFKNEVWTKNAEGIFEASEIMDQIAPGETKVVTRKVLTLIGIQPEFSLMLANGRLVGPSPDKIKGKDVNEVLSRYYFRFTQNDKNVHDPAFKIAIADGAEVEVDGKIEVKWTVKPEYEAAFGYLNNPKAKTVRTRASKKSDVNLTSAAVADFLTQLISQ